jgi:CRISPR/Cas system endoribonuclease Cas6 (RAMP superfamily)
MPFTLQLAIELETPPPPQGIGLGLHGMIYNQLRSVTPSIADTIHQERGQPHVPSAFSLGWRIAQSGTVFCQVHLLNEALLEPFTEALHTKYVFGEDTDHLRGEIVDTHLSGVRYEDLIRFTAITQPPQFIEMEFHTCTTSRHDNQTLNEPKGTHLWNGLRARWCTHSPFKELLEHSDFQLEYAEEPELQQSSIRIPQRIAHGWEGRALYEVIGSADDRRAAGLLAQFAEYSGVGQYVAYGAGNVRIRIR